jgi:hypothetical protein
MSKRLIAFAFCLWSFNAPVVQAQSKSATQIMAEAIIATSEIVASLAVNIGTAAFHAVLTWDRWVTGRDLKR